MYAMQAFLQRRRHSGLVCQCFTTGGKERRDRQHARVQPDVRHHTAPHAEQLEFSSADAASAKRSSTTQPPASGYIVAPTRPSQPATAVPDVIQPIRRNGPQHMFSTQHASRTQQTIIPAGATGSQNASGSATQRVSRHAGKTQRQVKGSSSQAQAKTAISSSQSPAITAGASGSSSRQSGGDPAKAFMKAGMPSGLWVLPLAARTDAPPAPPPMAPQDAEQLLRVLQDMGPPRRRLVIFKAGGYIYSEMEALITESGLAHILRLTNLIRKAHCVLAKPVWDNGRHVNLKQHQAAATKARVPFLTISKLDALQLVQAVRPVLFKKRIVLDPAPKRE